jgi:hypothetical protein
MRSEKVVGAFGGLVFLVWFLYAILSLAVTVGIIWAIIHFVAKFW